MKLLKLISSGLAFQFVVGATAFASPTKVLEAIRSFQNPTAFQTLVRSIDNVQARGIRIISDDALQFARAATSVRGPSE